MDRKCPVCGAILARRATEQIGRFLERQTCGKECGAILNGQRRTIPDGPSDLHERKLWTLRRWHERNRITISEKRKKARVWRNTVDPIRYPEGATRACPNCGETKPIEDFPRRGGSWRNGRCTVCKNAKNREEYAINPKVRERLKAYEAAHRLERNQRQRERRLENIERFRERERGYTQKYALRNLEKNLRWRKQNPEKFKEQATRTLHRRRARLANAPVIESISRRRIIERDKGTCYLCGEVLSDREVTLDHVVPLSRDGPHTEANLRVACRSCNCRKHAKTPEELYNSR